MTSNDLYQLMLLEDEEINRKLRTKKYPVKPRPWVWLTTIALISYFCAEGAAGSGIGFMERESLIGNLVFYIFMVGTMVLVGYLYVKATEQR
jgi:hypothetical protein